VAREKAKQNNYLPLVRKNPYRKIRGGGGLERERRHQLRQKTITPCTIGGGNIENLLAFGVNKKKPWSEVWHKTAIADNMTHPLDRGGGKKQGGGNKLLQVGGAP